MTAAVASEPAVAYMMPDGSILCAKCANGDGVSEVTTCTGPPLTCEECVQNIGGAVRADEVLRRFNAQETITPAEAASALADAVTFGGDLASHLAMEVGIEAGTDFVLVTRRTHNLKTGNHRRFKVTVTPLD